MPTLPQWSDASPAERGTIRETIHRRLTNHHRHTEVAIMHACGMTIETVREALAAMLKSGAVVKVSDKNRTFYAAVERK